MILKRGASSDGSLHPQFEDAWILNVLDTSNLLKQRNWPPTDHLLVNYDYLKFCLVTYLPLDFYYVIWQSILCIVIYFLRNKLRWPLM